MPASGSELPYSTYVGLEADAATISDFGLGLIPGLLQTEEYARAVLTAIYPRLTADVIEHRLAGRLEQERTLTSPSPPGFDAVLDEGVLHRVSGSPAVMRARLEYLLTASELLNVRISVLPYEAGLLPVPNNKFIVLSFREPTVPGVVFSEGLTGDLYLGPTDGLGRVPGGVRRDEGNGCHARPVTRHHCSRRPSAWPVENAAAQFDPGAPYDLQTWKNLDGIMSHAPPTGTAEVAISSSVLSRSLRHRILMVF